MKKFFSAAAAGSLFVLPFVALAGNDDLVDVFEKLGELVSVLTPVIVAVALLGFFWGLAMYVLNFSGEDKDKKKGRDMMVYGVIVLFVMVSVWGLVQVLQNTFLSGNPDSQLDDVPCVEGVGNC